MESRVARSDQDTTVTCIGVKILIKTQAEPFRVQEEKNKTKP